MKEQRGFSLIELLIVLLVLGILAAIAIPNLLATRRSANEGSAISDLRLLHGGQMTYASTFGQGDYAGDTGGAVNTSPFTQLGVAGIIDSVLAGGTKSGYTFTGARLDVAGYGSSSFCARAVPIVATGMGATGPRNIAVATSGVIHVADASASASAGCTVISGGLVVTLASAL